MSFYSRGEVGDDLFKFGKKVFWTDIGARAKLFAYQLMQWLGNAEFADFDLVHVACPVLWLCGFIVLVHEMLHRDTT